MGNPPEKSKRDILSELLDKGMVQILLDSRKTGVVLPDHLAEDMQLRLNLSRRFGLPIELTEEGVSATLTFQDVPHACVLPWDCIFAMISYVTGDPVLFSEDVPLEVIFEAEKAAASEPSETEDAPTSPRPQLRVVPNDEVDSDDEPQPDPPPPPTPASRGHLRVVK